MNEHSSIRLPKFDANAALQQRSVNALHALLQGQDDIILRAEKGPDYGADIYFEAIQSGGATNFRSQIQLKAAAKPNVNNDGSLSLSVKTSNLIYLLNGAQAPLYIFFDESNRQFWFAWARDEQRRLEAENPSWREQATVTIRFGERLTTGALPVLRDRILGEGRTARDVQDAIVRAGASEATFAIDSGALHTVDGATALKVLSESGLGVVTAGYASQAARLFDLIDPVKKNLPGIQLVAAYADYRLGKYHSALGHVGEATVRANDLTERDQRFLEAIRDACELFTGVINKDTYDERAKRRMEHADELEQLQNKAQLLRDRLASTTLPADRVQLLAELKETADKLRTHPDAPPMMCFAVRVDMHFIEGTEATAALWSQVAKITSLKMSLKKVAFFTFPGPLGERLTQASQCMREWSKQADRLVAEARHLGAPVLAADTIVALMTVPLFHMNFARMLAIVSGSTIPRVDEAVGKQLLATVEEAVSTYERCGVLKGSVQAKMLLADYLEVMGSQPLARRAAEEVQRVANAMSYPDLKARASELLEGRTLLSDFASQWNEARLRDPDIDLASLDAVRVRDLSLVVVENWGIPESRLPNVEHYFCSQQTAARERVDWCRHIELGGERRQIEDPVMAFNGSLNWRCRCAKHRYEGIISTDPNALIDSMKRIRCDGCRDREPAVKPAGDGVGSSLMAKPAIGSNPGRTDAVE